MTGTPARVASSSPPTTDGCAHHGDQYSGHALAALEQQDHRQRARTDRKRSPVGFPLQHGLRDSEQLPQRPGVLHGEAEHLGQLADQHGQRDSVHVAVTDRLGEQFGDETEATQASHDAHTPRDDCHHAGERDGAQRVTAGQRHNDGEDQGGQRGIRPQHEDAAWAKQRVRQQRHDGRVEPVDARHARCHRVGDTDRHQHGRQHQTGRDVMTQPADLVVAQGLEPGQPAQPTVLIPLRSHNATRFRQGIQRHGINHAWSLVSKSEGEWGV